jgi:uncharacterized protein (TIGR02217 family)
MPDVWVFGTYNCYNTNYDATKMSDRFNAKWRSQVVVPAGSVITGNVEDWFYINGNVHLVLISDLDYQLKNTEEVGDQFWIKRVVGAARRTDYDQLGINPVINFEYNGQPLTNPNPTNPNPTQFVKPTPTPKPLVNLGYLSFAEERLELGYDYGAVGGMGYETEITEVADDREQRNATRYLPKGRWQLGDRLIAESEADLLSEVSYLKQFHLDRLGSFQGFRFKDWSDFQGTNQDIATGNGVKTQFQLRKAYKVGSVVTYRPIQKPVVGTVDIFVNGVNVATIANHGWVVNHETGVLSNPTPLASGAKLTADFQFDVPVWFESDEIGFSLQAYEPETKSAIYRLESVFVVEGKIPPAITWDVQALTEITEELDLGIIYDTVEQYQFSTIKQELKSGYAIRESKREDNRLVVNLGNRNYDQSEVDKILAYFWNARGNLAEFPFKNLGKSYKVRFDQDQLNFKFEAGSDSDKLFNLSGLKLQLKEAPIYRIPPYNFAVTTLFINPQNPSDPVIASSNPSSGSGSSIGGSSGSSNQSSYNMASYIGTSNFDLLPPSSTSADQWRVAQIFWAAGKLWAVVKSHGTGVTWRQRCALYSLNSNGGFDYVDSNLKNYYTPNMEIKDLTYMFKTPTGISLFARADNSVPFGSGSGAATNGMLRFEIQNDGTQYIDFIADNLIPQYATNPPKSVKVKAVFGDRVYLDIGSLNNNINRDLGVRNGLRYLTGNWGNNSSGFPVDSNAVNANNQISRTTEPWNIWYEPTGTERFIYRNEDPRLTLERYFRVGSLNPSLQQIKQSVDGSIWVNLYLQGVCPDATCTSNFDSRSQLIHSVFLIDAYNGNQVKQLMRVLRPTTIGDANFKILNNIDSSYYRQLITDIKGNALAIDLGSDCYFYRASDSFAVNLASQLPGNYRAATITPYGFAVMSHASNLFVTGANPKLIFVQPQEV